MIARLATNRLAYDLLKEYIRVFLINPSPFMKQIVEILLAESKMDAKGLA